MSEEAARAAQHVLDLEFQLKESEEREGSLRAAFEAVKHDNERLETRLNSTVAERDALKAKLVEIETRFDDAAMLLVNIIERRKPQDVKPNFDQLEKDMKEDKNVNPVSDFAPGPRPAGV